MSSAYAAGIAPRSVVLNMPGCPVRVRQPRGLWAGDPGIEGKSSFLERERERERYIYTYIYTHTYMDNVFYGIPTCAQ